MRIPQRKNALNAHFAVYSQVFMRIVRFMADPKPKRKKKKSAVNLTLTDWVVERSKDILEKELGLSLSSFVNMKLMEELAKRGRNIPPDAE